ncbi:MAG: serine/threonine protein kinase [Acidobacteria bacterium]|jgi:tetratricopeptide (TPR) repeat protein|nr:serine/threonine protein kinase [Acidobacteriota bacterium]
MTIERQARVRALFEEALTRPTAARRAYVESACGDDPALAAEVMGLVEANAQAGAFLDHLSIDAGADPAGDVVGQRIGPYSVVREIGRGGMGRVYLATRADDQFRKQVAIKVVSAAFDGLGLSERFARERQILANLDHPFITRLIDAGTTDTGLPFIVMDAVDGVPIDVYGQQQRLGVRQRLELFRKVCDAVQYAHRHLVIHRDLKPSNILVTADGTPRLLDFGIAKLLSADDAPDAARTMTGAQMMTPEYASPEQAQGEAVTTATDVYSLGVLLFQVLTGKRPYQWTTQRLDEIVRVICETPAPRPSAVAPAADARAIAGDLDAIVQMALRKEPERRYASVGHFADDIRLHLAGAPIAARTDAFGYRAGKFVRRHRVGVAAAALVAVALTSGLGVALWQARIARRERAEAEAQRARAERRFNDVRKLAGSFLFEFHDAVAPLAGSTPARTLLVAKSLEYLDSLAREAADDPTLQEELAAAYDRVGDVQGNPSQANLGDVERALESYRKAEAIRTTLADQAPQDVGRHERLATSAVKIADALFGRGDMKAAVTQYQRVREVREDALRLSPDSLAIQTALAEVSGRLCTTLIPVGDVKGALDNCARNAGLLDVLIERVPQNPAFTAQRALNRLATGNAQRMSGDPQAAAASLAAGVEALARQVAAAPDNADMRRRLAVGYAYLANAKLDLGDAKGAAGSYGDAIDNLSRLVDVDPSNARFRTDLVYMLLKRGELLVKAGDVAGGRTATGRALGLMRAVALAPNAPPETLNEYAWALVSCEPADLRQPALALALAQRVVTAAAAPNPVHLHTLAWAQFRTGSAPAAVATAERALAAMTTAAGPALGLRKQIETDLAVFRTGQ